MKNSISCFFELVMIYAPFSSFSLYQKKMTYALTQQCNGKQYLRQAAAPLNIIVETFGLFEINDFDRI